MKKTLAVTVLGSVFFFACKKQETPIASNTFEASINGVKKIFQTGMGANLMRSPGNGIKQMSFLGISEDNQTELEIMLFETPHTGDGVSNKTYTIRMQNNDNPSTPFNEGENSKDAAIRYGVFTPGAGWSSEAYRLNGKIIIQKCDIRNKQISGYFEQTGVSLINGQTVFITNGTFENISYRIVD